MKLSTNTIRLIKSFSTINQSMVFKAGKTLSTINASRSIFAKANIDHEIEFDFAIFELSKFLSTLAMFDDPELTLDGKMLLISEGTKTVRYETCDPGLIVNPPVANIKLPTVDAEFHISMASLQDLLKAVSVLQLPEIAIVGDGSRVSVKALKTATQSGSSYSQEIANTESNFDFTIVADNMKIIPGDYDVSLSNQGLAVFKNDVVEYALTASAKKSR